MVDKLDLLKKELERRKFLEYPCKFVPYTNRDGSKSWQQLCEELLIEENTKEILAVCSNGSGKTALGAYLILSILYGKHPICKLINKPFYAHVICESFGTQQSTMQAKLAEISDYVFDPYGKCSDPNVSIYRHSGVIKQIYHNVTKNQIKFSSASEGQEGLVGISPNLVILDEPVSQEVYKELVARIREPKARFLMTCTPLNSKHAWIIYKAKDQLVTPQPNTYVLTSPSIQNPYFDVATLEYWKQTMGEDSIDYKVRALGELEVLNGLVMPSFRKNVVPNNYKPTYEGEEMKFVWLEAADYGTYDGTLIVFAKLYENGEIVIEREWYSDKSSSLRDWVDAYQEIREELGVPIKYDEFGNPKIYKGGSHVMRTPACSIGDGQELQKQDKSSGNKLTTLFAMNGLYIQKAPKTSLAWGLKILNSLLDDGVIKVKERCENLIDNATKHTFKYKETTGEASTASKHDIAFDVLRYLMQVPQLSKVIQAYATAQEKSIKILKEHEERKEAYLATVQKNYKPPLNSI